MVHVYRVLNLTLTYSPISLFKWQMYAAQSMRNKWTSMLGTDFMEDQDEDQDSLKVLWLVLGHVEVLLFLLMRIDFDFFIYFFVLIFILMFFVFSQELTQSLTHLLIKHNMLLHFGG